MDDFVAYLQNTRKKQVVDAENTADISNALTREGHVEDVKNQFILTITRHDMKANRIS